jgi:OmpA-OmpF porin, OOP family
MRPLLVLLLLVPSVAFAKPIEVELGGFLGAHFFSSKNELGAIAGSTDDTALADSFAFGLRVGFFVHPRISVEGELIFLPTATNNDATSAFVFGYRAQGLYHFMSGRLRPFALVGVGGMTVSPTDTNIVGEDSDLMIHLGGGVKYGIGAGKWGVRVDARLLFPPARENNFVTVDGELLAGVYVMFGGSGSAGTVATENDPDGDGVGAIDGCPDVKEDMDEFEDADGCPDPDNDGDGVLDENDKCANQMENKNDYQDDDGCADEIPAELAKFTGAIEGIQFETSSSKIKPQSFAVLDKAVGVLKQFPNVGIEIAGHTDSTGDPAVNRQLSHERAEAVRAYLVKKGIDEKRLTAVGQARTSRSPTTRPPRGARRTAASSSS